MRAISSVSWSSIVAAAAIASWVSDAAALPPSTSDPRAVMKAVDTRDDGDKATTRMTMVIKDPGGGERVRTMTSRSLDFEGGKRQLIFFESPADVRNTGLLTVDYDDGNKVDDQWLYLPNLRKSTRISSTKKSGSFMGSDISFSDMTRQAPDNYDFKMVKQSTTAGGDDCWLIETRPRTAKAREETGYVKSLVWVSKSKLLPIQSKHWIKAGKKIKLMKFAKIERVDGIWFAKKIMARTLRNSKPLSTTVLTFSAVKFNAPGIQKSDFSQRRLEQGI